MNLFNRKFAISIPFFLSSVSCSITAECNTAKKAVLKKFTADTTELFEKLPNIKSCGVKYTKASGLYSTFDTIGYKNCITDLEIPESYEIHIAKLDSYNFDSYIDFRNAIKNATTMVCYEFNNAHFYDRNGITRKTYKVTGNFSANDFKEGSSEIRNGTGSHSYAPQNITYLFIIGGFLIFIIILFTIFTNCLMSDSDKLLPEVYIIRNYQAKNVYPDIVCHNSHNDDIQKAPPPYNQI